MATSTSHTIRFSHDLQVNKSRSITITRLLSGTLEMSALYRFQFLVEVTWPPNTTGTDCSASIATLLGQRVHVTAIAADATADAQGSGKPATVEEKAFQHIHGIIMSIESTTAYGKVEQSKSTYILTVRPELAKACYSRNRTVHTAASCAALLTNLAKRWNTVLVLCGDAEKRLPRFLQLRQNDESDYNFLARILASCGLGYYWVMPGSSSQTPTNDTPSEDTPSTPNDREYLCVFNATSINKERDDKGGTHFGSELEPTSIMVPVSQSTSLWKLNFGFQNLTGEEVQVGNYNAPTSQATTPAKAPKVSLHDETWDQCIQGSLTEANIKGIYQSSHNNACTCHGMFLLGSTDAEFSSKISQAGKLHIGGKITWRSTTTADAAQYGSDTSSPFYITKLSIDATDKTWRATIDGRNPRDGAGLGVLPRPVNLNNRPELGADGLITDAPWPGPRMRLFLAIVEDSSTYSAPLDAGGKTISTTLTARNLCKVREIAPTVISSDKTTNTSANTLWVELGSPFADNDSGLLTRPRKGNVLVCLDRGDLSIPLAISSLFRDNNATPFAKLQTKERHSSTALQDTIDSTTVTLRNRVQLPPRSYDDDSSHSDIPIDLAPEGTNTTRPLSVTQLAEKPLPFSQIQLVSRDNGTNPIPHNNDITKTYMASSVVETVAGTLSDTDSSGSYVMANTAKIIQSQLNAPISRPHFEGINMYSSCDVLMQSADHQLFNAGGEIVLTADKGITLRVGKSSIKITESGIEIISGTGIVTNPGAYPAYHPADSTQVTRLMNNSTYPLSGSIVVDSSGVALKGPYISNTVTNLFKASTFLGSVFSVSDYAAKLYAPKTTIIGGAAVESTSMTIVPSALKFIVDISETGLGRDSVYTGTLKDGWKTTGPNLSSISGSIVSCISTGLSWGLGLTSLAMEGGFASLFSITGSMVKLEPTTLTLSGQKTTNYQSHLIEVNTPLAGFCAMAERAGRRNLLKQFPKKLITQPEVMAATMFILDAERLISNASRKSGGSKADTFSKLDASYSPPSVKGGNVAEQVVTGILGCAAYTGISLGYSKLLRKGFNWLQNLLYLGKRDYAWGIAKIEAIRESTSTLQKKIDSVDNKLLALKGEDSRVTSNCRNALGAMDNIRFINKSVNHTTNVANQVTQCLTDEEKGAIRNRAISMDTVSGQLTTRNGQQINI